MEKTVQAERFLVRDGAGRPSARRERSTAPRAPRRGRGASRRARVVQPPRSTQTIHALKPTAIGIVRLSIRRGSLEEHTQSRDQKARFDADDEPERCRPGEYGARDESRRREGPGAWRSRPCLAQALRLSVLDHSSGIYRALGGPAENPELLESSSCRPRPSRRSTGSRSASWPASR